jgi:hypothetical protein
MDWLIEGVWPVVADSQVLCKRLQYGSWLFAQLELPSPLSGLELI